MLHDALRPVTNEKTKLLDVGESLERPLVKKCQAIEDAVEGPIWAREFEGVISIEDLRCLEVDLAACQEDVHAGWMIVTQMVAIVHRVACNNRHMPLCAKHIGFMGSPAGRNEVLILITPRTRTSLYILSRSSRGSFISSDMTGGEDAGSFCGEG